MSSINKIYKGLKGKEALERSYENSPIWYREYKKQKDNSLIQT